jgi:hypothetical protein
MLGRGVLLALVALSTGYWLGHSTRPAAEEKIVRVSELDGPTKEKLQALTENEIADYYRLKTMEEKFEKANEILGKVMQIFVADLGLKISQQTLNRAKNPAPLASAPATPKTVLPPPEPKSKPEEKPRPHHYSPAAVKSLKDIDEFLELAKIEKFGNSPRFLGNFSNREDIVSQMSGTFSGNCQTATPVRTWNILFELAAPSDRNPLQFYLQLSEGGRVFSRVNRVSALKDYTSDAAGFIVLAQTNIFLQVYYLKNFDMLVGHVYQSKFGSYAPVCSFQLARQNNQ